MNANGVKVKNGIASGYLCLALYVLLFSCSKENVAPLAKGVEVRTDARFGKIITDDQGKSLYFFSTDVGVSSTCTGGCLTVWPIFHVDNIAIGTGLEQADFGEITNVGGAKQTTYKGWPLYYYTGDEKAGEINGDKSGDVWYVAKPDYSVMVGKFRSVKFLVAPKGRTLYTFANDTNGASACTSTACTANWPPFLINANSVVPSLISNNSLTEITRTDGRQTAYKGKPLYYFVNDLVRGDSTGQGLANGAFLKLTQANF